MEALTIFSHRGGSLASTHFDSDPCSSRVPSSRKKGGPCCVHLSSSPNDGRARNSDSRSGSSSQFTKVHLCTPKEEESTKSGKKVLAKGSEAAGYQAAVFGEEGTKSGKKVFANGKARIDVRALARRLWDCRTEDDVHEVFDEMSDFLPPQVYSTMVKGLGVDKKVDSAFALVAWIRRKSKDTNGVIGPNLFVYNALLGALKQNRRFEHVDRVMEDMKEDGIRPNIVTYNLLMSIFIEQDQPGAALSVLDRLGREELVPSPATYSTALLAYWRMGDALGALAFFVELREKYARGEVCNSTDENWEAEFVKLKDYTIRVCYKVMRGWLVMEGDPTADVMKLLSAMDKVKVTPGRAEYEKLLWACTNEGHFSVAKEFYERLRELDSGISLSVCNHVIWVMGRAKKWWAALEVYEDLLDKGPKPNNLSYELIVSHFNILLGAARRRALWRWGVRLIDKMQEKGLKPGSKEWNAVLVACSKASEASTAVQIFGRMIEQGEKPNILSYGALLSALEKGKLYDEALSVWEHMCKVGVKPNSHAYTILTSIYIGKGEPEKVDSVIQEMDSSGVLPTVITFNAIISGCARNDLASAAFEWFQCMKIRNIAPNEITYEMLIESLARDAKPKLAYEMYMGALNEGLQLSSRAYDSVLESCDQYDASVNLSSMGPRPLGKNKTFDTRTFSDFCNSPVPHVRGKPLYRETTYHTQTTPGK